MLPVSHATQSLVIRSVTETAFGSSEHSCDEEAIAGRMYNIYILTMVCKTPNPVKFFDRVFTCGISRNGSKKSTMQNSTS